MCDEPVNLLWLPYLSVGGVNEAGGKGTCRVLLNGKKLANKSMKS